MAISRYQWPKLLFPGVKVLFDGSTIGPLFARFRMDIDTP